MAKLPPPPQARVETVHDAAALNAAVLDALELLEPLIAEETALLKKGETAQALALSAEKTHKARAYVRAIETLKANAIAVQRLQPEGLAEVRARHESFGEILAYNMQVLATARSVSESIIREVSAEVAKAAEPSGYGPGGGKKAQTRPKSAPLSVSKSA